VTHSMLDDPADDVRRLLADTPVLPDEPGRVAAVRARVTRTRRLRLAGAGLGLVVLVAVGLAMPRGGTDRAEEPPAVPAASLGPDGCPAAGLAIERPRMPARGDRGFHLPDGASEVLLCERVVDEAGRYFDPRAGEARSLVAGADEVVAELNRIPDGDRVRRDADAGGAEVACQSRGYFTQLSFVVRYPHRGPAAVWLDPNCGTATAGGRSRFGYGSALLVFFREYRSELAAHAGTRPPPACDEVLTTVDLNRNTPRGREIDEVARQRAEGEPFLPSPLRAVRVCRYEIGIGGVGHRSGEELVPPSMHEHVRYIVNSQLDDTSATICDEDVIGTAVTILDVLFVVDETGAVAEIRLPRRPCAAALVANRTPVHVWPALHTIVDGGLGEP
jgi:hypothetical protein